MTMAGVGAALENFLRKNVFKLFFLPMQCCRYGVLYEYSSRNDLKKKIIMSEICINIVFRRLFTSCFCVGLALGGHFCW